MGNHLIKFLSHNNVDVNNEIRKPSPEKKDEVTTEDDSVQTPVMNHTTLSLDPRSITSGIERTPIEVKTPVRLNKKISAIPRHLQTKSYLETDIDKVIPCILQTPKKHFSSKVMETTRLQLPDMLNKSVEVLSTPVASNVDKLNLSSVERDRYEILGIDPRSPAANFNRTPLLKPKSIERLRARSQESLHRQGSYDEYVHYPRFAYCEMSSQFNVPEIRALPDLATCLANTLSFDNTTSSEVSDKSESSSSNCSSNIETTTGKGENDCTDKIKIWTNSMVLEKVQESGLNDIEADQGRISQAHKEDIIITFDDNSISKDTLSLKMSKPENNKARGDLKKTKVRDDKKVFSSIDKIEGETIKPRTPLGNRSNSGQQHLTKSPQQVFRNKGITKMFQENTPPHTKCLAKSKLNGTQWDPDSTIII